MRWKPLRKKVKYAALYQFIIVLFWMAEHFPRKWILAIYKQLGILSYHLLVPVRALITKHLNYAYGTEVTRMHLKEFTRKMFINMAKNVADVFIARPFRKVDELDGLIGYEGLHHLEEAYQKGEGVIALTCHMGAFELIGAALAFRYPTNVVGKRLHNPKMDQLVVNSRKGHGANVVYSGEGMLKIVRMLKKGEVVIILIDQDISKVKGVFVDFYGKPAYTPIGAAWLALNTNAVVVPMAISRQPNEQHLLRILPAVEVSRTGDSEHDLKENTQRFTHALEQLIRQDPTQWVWMHKRWKTQPKDIAMQKMAT
jgi:Kdo2-lipid IVA lauroyltransferase/acyltransferase